MWFGLTCKVWELLKNVNHIRNIWQGKSVPEHKGIPLEELEQL